MKSRHDKKINPTKVYQLLNKIPQGKVTTYGNIAEVLGNRKAARLIGKILHNNPNPIIVPCHRVIKSDGSLGGYFFGRERKQEILKKEGVAFQDQKLKSISAMLNVKSLSKLLLDINDI